MCIYHENLKFLLEPLSKHFNMPTVFRDFLATVVCDQESEMCMLGNCNIFSNAKLSHQSYDMSVGKSTRNITFYQWETVNGRITKNRKEENNADCYNLLEHKLFTYSLNGNKLNFFNSQIKCFCRKLCSSSRFCRELYNQASGRCSKCSLGNSTSYCIYNVCVERKSGR